MSTILSAHDHWSEWYLHSRIDEACHIRCSPYLSPFWVKLNKHVGFACPRRKHDAAPRCVLVSIVRVGLPKLPKRKGPPKTRQGTTSCHHRDFLLFLRNILDSGIAERHDIARRVCAQAEATRLNCIAADGLTTMTWVKPDHMHL
jgi:hypothetical protein